MESFESKIDEIFDCDISEEVESQNLVIEEGKILDYFKTKVAKLAEKWLAKLQKIDEEVGLESYIDQAAEIIKKFAPAISALLNEQEGVATEDVIKEDAEAAQMLMSLLKFLISGGVAAGLVVWTLYGVVDGDPLRPINDTVSAIQKTIEKIRGKKR